MPTEPACIAGPAPRSSSITQWVNGDATAFVQTNASGPTVGRDSDRAQSPTGLSVFFARRLMAQPAAGYLDVADQRHPIWRGRQAVTTLSARLHCDEKAGIPLAEANPHGLLVDSARAAGGSREYWIRSVAQPG